MPNGQPRRSLDPSRARELFGFSAQVPLREGIARTVAWYRSQIPVVARQAAGYPDGAIDRWIDDHPPSQRRQCLAPCIEPGELRLEQRQPLGEHRALVVELREHRRVVQQHDDDEQRRDGEQDRRRVVSTPNQPAIVLRPPRQAERTSSTTPVTSHSSAYRSFRRRPRISSSTIRIRSSEAIAAAIEIFTGVTSSPPPRSARRTCAPSP